MSLKNYLMGRQLLKEEIPIEYHNSLKSNGVKKVKSLKENKERIVCNRCGLSSLKKEVTIKKRESRYVYYCPNCIGLGRMDSSKFLYSLKEGKGKKREVVFQWQGKLTKGQKRIASALVKGFFTGKNQLVHAVTGAGKTEMLFPLINIVLSKGKRIAVVSPRVDVCMELHPRFKQVFPKENISLLYGKQEELYKRSPFVVATTHQMLRFYQSFDVIVVDEVDAFPFAGNQVLNNGVKRALKKKGLLIYLTATPDKDLLTMVSKGEIVLNSLPQRYHGYPLPVPKCYFDFLLLHRLCYDQLSPYLIKFLNQSNKQCLLFFSNIKRMEKCFYLLKKKYPEKKIAYVYANKVNREEIILKMRQGEIDWLLTTTILERGVTFPNIDVVVYESDHRIFNVASLVQIAGRVGRKVEYPTGEVIFIHKGKTSYMKQAINQINRMNKEAVLL